MKMKKIFVLLISSLVLLILASSIITGLIKISLPGMTVLSVSKIEIDPQNGYEDKVTGEWKGSFWVITMLTDCTDQVAAYTFDKTESEKGTNTIGDKTLVPQSTITIKIDPQQPYWERPLELKSVTVVPATYTGYQHRAMIGSTLPSNELIAGELISGHYEWGTGYWIAHTPFLVTILKNGVKISDPILIDTLGVPKTYRIPNTGEEYLTISDLGKLAVGYGEPQLGDVMFFSMDYIFKKDLASFNLVKYDDGATYKDIGYYRLYETVDKSSYSVYWYGFLRWNADHYGFPIKNTPAPWIDEETMVDADKYGGWINADTTLDFVRNPIKPVIFKTEKASALPLNKQSFLSLTEYLVDKGVTLIDPWVWKDSTKPEVITESATGAKKLRVYLPFGSMNSLITIKISTELADTIVWQPQAANIKITSMPDLGDIGDRKLGSITLKQESAVASSGIISLTVIPTTAPLSINPPSFGTGTMNPGDIKTFTYEVVNLGGDANVPFTITAVITNSLGAVTDTGTASGTLLPKGVGGETILTVYTMDDKSKEKVSGITITITYDSQSKTDVTSDGSRTWNLGSITPTVTITSAETPTFKSKTVSQKLVAGPNTVYLWLIRQGTIEIDNTLMYILIAGTIISVIIVIAVILIWYWKKKRTGEIVGIHY